MNAKLIFECGKEEKIVNIEYLKERDWLVVATEKSVYLILEVANHLFSDALEN